VRVSNTDFLPGR